MKHLLLTITLTLFAALAQAHEGHDHDAPKSVRPIRGGIVKALEQVQVEVVAKGADLRIYLFKIDGEKTPLNPADFKLAARAEIPRSKKVETVALTLKPDVAEARFEAKGLHRYTLLLDVNDPEVGHADTLKFTIEPRK